MLRVEDSEGVRTLTLDRPDRLNTLTPALIGELHKALIDCARDPGVKAVVLAGAGRGFCAGFDLSGGGEAPDPLGERWAEEPIWWEPEQVAARLLEDAQIPILLHRMAKPTIAGRHSGVVGRGRRRRDRVHKRDPADDASTHRARHCMSISARQGRRCD